MPFTSGKRELVGDGFGWHRYSKALPSAPTGTNQAIYVLRYWFDTFPISAKHVETSLTWPKALYVGFSFDGAHIDLTRPENYPNFFGYYIDRNHNNESDISIRTDADGDTAGARTYPTTHDDLSFAEGNGYNAFTTHIDSGDGAPMYGSIPSNPTRGQTITRVIVVTKSTTDHSVFVDVFCDAQSLDLTTPDFLEDIDPDNPRSSFTIDSGITSPVLINGSGNTGTNWVDESGNFQVPTHFLSRYSLRTQKLVIEAVGVRYDTISS